MNWFARSFTWLVIFSTTLASSQSVEPIPLELPKSPNPFNAYMPAGVPAPVLVNSPPARSVDSRRQALPFAARCHLPGPGK